MFAVKLENVSKKYIVSHEKEALVRHILPHFLRIKTYEELEALRDINLFIPSGQTLGILGRNGAGKTTLLNIISRVTFPSQGKVFVNGRVSCMVGLGAGFHPELTGEENIYMNGVMLGLKIKEIKERFKEIVDFAELGNFINAPLLTYSQGMYMRLGFAIAINVNFDILLIDEILTVGDLYFQNKCINKIKEFKQKQKTIIIVSQSPSLLNELCDRVILLEKGRIIKEGLPQKVGELYHEMMFVGEQAVPLESKESESISSNFPQKEYFRKNWRVSCNNWGTISGTKEAEITKVMILNSQGKETHIFKTGERMLVRINFFVRREIENPHFGVAIFREDGTYVYGPNTRFDGLHIERLKKGEGEFSIEYKNLNLLSGKYHISVAIWPEDESFAYDYHEAYYKFEVVSEKKDHGMFYLEHNWRWRLP
jgi:ABC-type polysaccharide/polyol phosphate transport system ATPase subunit/antitoxin component YwqK of YwqJK toxin-antitoxin module